MNINENTVLPGFIAWLICSCNLGFKNYQLAVEKQNEAPVVNPVVKTLVWPGLENRDYA